MISNECYKYDYTDIINKLFSKELNPKNNFNYEIFEIFEQILKKDKYGYIYTQILNDFNEYFYNVSDEGLIYISKIIYSYCILHFNNINDDEILKYTKYLAKKYSRITLEVMPIHYKYYNFILNKYISMMNTW